MTELVYNNAKNAGIYYMLFKLNCGYYLRVSYKKDFDPCSKFKLANKLANDLIIS